MNFFFVALLTGVMHAAHTFTKNPASGTGTLLGFGYALLAAFFVGRAFRDRNLPKLTGYILTGIAVGPAGLGYLTTDAVDSLRVVGNMAVALIALAAGCELDVRAMRPLLRSVAWVSVVAVGGTVVLLSAAVFAGRGWLPFFGGLNLVQSITVSIMLGVVMAAQSPAVVMALIDETRAQGPVTQTTLGVVVIADLAVIVLFAVASLAARTTLSGAGADTHAALRLLSWEILGSLGVGAAIGALLGLYLRKVTGGAELFLMTVAFAMAEVGRRVALDPLIIALAAGVLVRNLTGRGDALKTTIERSSMSVSIVFFAVAGATIHLDALAIMGVPAAILVLVRAAGLLVGGRIGAGLAGASPEVKRWVGLGLLPQAGLAIALSQLLVQTFPDLGAGVGALTFGVIAINEVGAPTLFRLALVRSGEAERRAAAS